MLGIFPNLEWLRRSVHVDTALMNRADFFSHSIIL